MILLGLGVVVGVSLLASVPVEVPAGVPAGFEVQVVLGGNTVERGRISDELWQRRPSPVIVTGDGGYTITELRKRGIPEAQLIHEAKATTTWENAVFTTPLLRNRGMKRVVIVTSDYHSARALSCFREMAPEMEFHLATQPAEERSGWDDFQLRVREKLKRLGYGLVHGVSPWG